MSDKEISFLGFKLSISSKPLVQEFKIKISINPKLFLSNYIEKKIFCVPYIFRDN